MSIDRMLSEMMEKREFKDARTISSVSLSLLRDIAGNKKLSGEHDLETAHDELINLFYTDESFNEFITKLATLILNAFPVKE